MAWRSWTDEAELPDGARARVELRDVLTVRCENADGTARWATEVDPSTSDPEVWGAAYYGIERVTAEAVHLVAMGEHRKGGPLEDHVRRWVLGCVTGVVLSREPAVTPYERKRDEMLARYREERARPPAAPTPAALAPRLPPTPPTPPRAGGVRPLHTDPHVEVDGRRYVVASLTGRALIRCEDARTEERAWQITVATAAHARTAITARAPGELEVTLSFDPDPPSAADAHLGFSTEARVVHRMLRVAMGTGEVIEQVDLEERIPPGRDW